MLTEQASTRISGIQAKSLMLGAAGIGATLALGWLSGGAELIFQSMLIAYFLFLSLGLGCLAVLMLHHLCGGGWGFLIQRICEAGSRTLPLLAVMGAFVLLGGAYWGGIYPWTDAEYMSDPHNQIVANKAMFLNLNTFTLCFFLYFGLWLALMYCFNKWSRNLDATGDHANVAKMRRFAAPGLIIYVLSLTLASTHWIMSLEPEWFSTIYGAWAIAGQGLTVMSFCAIVLSYLAGEPRIKALIQVKHFHHLGNFMLGFTVFWAYISFSQFLIIWNANLPEEIGWYRNRLGGGLTELSVFLMVFHWFIPMLLLLIRKNKKTVSTLRTIAFYILGVRILDTYWNIAPSFESGHSTFNWGAFLCTLIAIAGLGGIWLWVFLAELKKRPLVPEQDPREELYFFKDEAHSHA